MLEKAVVVGVQSRQNYMAVNNRLLQAVGASRLMDEAVRDFPAVAGTWGARTIYAGGGNAAVLFSGQDKETLERSVREALGSWSASWLKQAPEIRLAVGTADVDEQAGGLEEGRFQAWQRARLKALPAYEERGSFGCELGFQPVTEQCPDTGRAAQWYDRHTRQWLSMEALKKNRKGIQYNQRLNEGVEDRDMYERVLGSGHFWFPRDLEQLGLQFNARHIAVVHCDGDGVGNMFDGVNTLAEVTGRSEEMTRWSREALLRPFEALRAAYPALLKGRVIREVLYQDAIPYFPARMLVAAGDDANWVCHGRLGLALAVRYCLHFQRLTRLTACAGVAIVPVGFPYRRAYELAGELCGKAKRKRKETQNLSSCFIDFHVVTEGSPNSVEQVRLTDYRRGLPHRPFAFSVHDLAEWREFEERWRFFTTEWGESRSRAKRLLEEISISQTRGKECADLFATQDYCLPAASAANPDNVFDALEFLDFHADWPVDRAEFQEENDATA